MTAREQLCLNPTDLVILSITLVSKVTARPARISLVGKYVDESNVNNVQGWILAEVTETGLIVPLALESCQRQDRRENSERRTDMVIHT